MDGGAEHAATLAVTFIINNVRKYRVHSQWKKGTADLSAGLALLAELKGRMTPTQYRELVSRWDRWVPILCISSCTDG
jgi:hypothetical protein